MGAEIKYFHQPGYRTVIDIAVQRDDGVLVSGLRKETLEDLHTRYPNVCLISQAERDVLARQY